MFFKTDMSGSAVFAVERRVERVLIKALIAGVVSSTTSLSLLLISNITWVGTTCCWSRPTPEDVTSQLRRVPRFCLQP